MAVIYYIVCILAFVLLSLTLGVGSFRSLAGALIAFLLGVHVVRSYIRKERIDFGWATIEYSGNPVERFFYLLAGLASIVLAVVALAFDW